MHCNVLISASNLPLTHAMSCCRHVQTTAFAAAVAIAFAVTFATAAAEAQAGRHLHFYCPVLHPSRYGNCIGLDGAVCCCELRFAHAIQ